MIPVNIVELIKALNRKTKDKKAIWAKTSRQDEFKLNLSQGAITIDKWDNGLGTEYIDFAIYNSNGDKIENYNIKKGDEDFELLNEMHNSAKREFYKVDETINYLFDEINNTKSIGKRSTDEEDDLPF